MSENGIATAEDFRKAAEAEAFEEPERLVLPKCGLAVILRRPRPVAFALIGGSLPRVWGSGVWSLPAQAGPESEGGTTDNGQGATDFSKDELIEISRFWTRLFTAMFVQPGMSLAPGPEEIHPGWIPAEDQVFLIRWAVGEVASDGSDLAAFRRGQP